MEQNSEIKIVDYSDLKLQALILKATALVIREAIEKRNIASDIYFKSLQAVEIAAAIYKAPLNEIINPKNSDE